MVVHDVPMTVLDVPIMVRDVPILVRDVPIMVRDVPMMVRDVSMTSPCRASAARPAASSRTYAEHLGWQQRAALIQTQ